MVDGHPTESQFSITGLVDARACKGKVPAWVVSWVGHHYQVRPVTLYCPEARERVVCPEVAVDGQERRRSQQRQGLEDAAAGFQGFGLFVRPVDVEAPAAAVAQCIQQQVSQVSLVNDDLPEASPRQCLQVIFDQCFAGYFHQGLGQFIGQGAQALSAAGGEDHGAHSFCSSILWNS